DEKNRGLGVGGERQGFGRAFADDARQRKAEGVVGFLKQLAGAGELRAEVDAHADGLGALSGKDEGNGVEHGVIAAAPRTARGPESGGGVATGGENRRHRSESY